MKYYILLSIFLGGYLIAMDQVEVTGAAHRYRVQYTQTPQGLQVTSVTPLGPVQPAQTTGNVSRRTSCFAKSKTCCLIALHGGALTALAWWMYVRLHNPT